MAVYTRMWIQTYLEPTFTLSGAKKPCQRVVVNEDGRGG